LQQIEDLKDQNLDSQSDLSICFENREQELKKIFKSKLDDYKRENTLIEKKFNLYKDMYKKLKNEKLDIVQYGSNPADPKILFLTQGCNTNPDLDLSQISQIPMTADNDEISRLKQELQAAKDKIAEKDQQNNELISIISTNETKFNSEMLRLTKENEDLKSSNQDQKSVQTIQKKYDNLFEEVLSQKVAYKDLENVNKSIKSALSKANLQLTEKDQEIMRLQEELSINKKAHDEEILEAKKEVIGFTNQLTEELLKHELNEQKLKTEYDQKIDKLTVELFKLKQKEGNFIDEDDFFGCKLEDQKKPTKKVEHKRIVCDACYKCPIYGNRYKSLQHENYDLCEACYVQLNVKDPVIKMNDLQTITPEKLDELLPYFRALFKDIKDGKCSIVFNNGFD